MKNRQILSNIGEMVRRFIFVIVAGIVGLVIAFNTRRLKPRLHKQCPPDAD